ncbi:MAG: PTS sugar transporter subunit IIA [Planctomycetia bacterium]|nr:PTS sugar transporter subunit IIA [Planctomycetia bacterium]
MQEEYTLAELGHLLKRAERIIQKDAESGLISGRKVHGQWHFSLNAITDYVAKNIVGGGPESELVEILRNTPRISTPEHPVSIAGFFSAETVAPNLPAKTPSSVIFEMTKLGYACGKLWDPKKMSDAVAAREAMLSTAMEGGVALLHPRHPMPKIIDGTFLSLGITSRGIPFGGGFNNLTDIFFLICSEDDTIHLRILAKLGRILRQKDFIETLRTLATPLEIIDWIDETERAVSVVGQE